MNYLEIQMTNKHLGSSFDDFLEEEGLLEECKEGARKKVEALIKNNEKETRIFYDVHNKYFVEDLIKAIQTLFSKYPSMSMMEAIHPLGRRYISLSIDDEDTYVDMDLPKLLSVGTANLNIGFLDESRKSLQESIDKIKEKIDEP